MGMRGVLAQISPQKLSELIANPRTAYKQLDAAIAKHRKEMLKVRPGSEKASLSVSRLTKKKTASASQEEFRIFSLEKDWHSLHYILNGTAEGGDGPLANTVLGGKEISDLDQSKDQPMRYLTPAQVKAVAKALAEVDFAKLATRYNQQDRPPIYGMPSPALHDFAARIKQIHGAGQRLEPKTLASRISPRKRAEIAAQFRAAFRKPSSERRIAMKKLIEAQNARLEAMLGTPTLNALNKAYEQKAQELKKSKAMQISPEEVSGFVVPIRDFYEDAARRGNAMLLYIT